jgi:hypothetical protein
LRDDEGVSANEAAERVRSRLGAEKHKHQARWNGCGSSPVLAAAAARSSSPLGPPVRGTCGAAPLGCSGLPDQLSAKSNPSGVVAPCEAEADEEPRRARYSADCQCVPSSNAVKERMESPA